MDQGGYFSKTPLLNQEVGSKIYENSIRMNLKHKCDLIPTNGNKFWLQIVFQFRHRRAVRTQIEQNKYELHI